MASFVGISRNNAKKQIILQNDIQKTDVKHNFVVLNVGNAQEGPTKTQLTDMYEGSYINFGNFHSLHILWI